jgi:hypothetical protein
MLQRQPGKLFTSWTSLRFAGFSVLGALSLVTAILSLLYTTAAGALGRSTTHQSIQHINS